MAAVSDDSQKFEVPQFSQRFFAVSHIEEERVQHNDDSGVVETPPRKARRRLTQGFFGDGSGSISRTRVRERIREGRYRLLRVFWERAAKAVASTRVRRSTRSLELQKRFHRRCL